MSAQGINGPPPRFGAGAALVILCAANLLNYADRQVLFAVFPQIQTQLGLSDARLGALASAFMVIYMLAAPVLGPLGDRWRRVRVAALGVGLWSLATIGSGLAWSYSMLLLCRGFIGIGEAGYGAVAPALISDLVPSSRRGTVLAIFYAAIPVGSALGYALGALVGGAYGWRVAFRAAGLPGLLIAALAWAVSEPPRGDRTPWAETPDPPENWRGVRAYAAILAVPSFRITAGAMAATTFALGGLAAWFPTYLVRIGGREMATSGTALGLVTLMAGLSGTAAGGWLGDRWQLRTPSAYLFLSGCGFLLGGPFALLAILFPASVWTFPLIFAAEFFIFLHSGPLNALIAGVVPAGLRARAFACNIFLIHALGDAVSPTILGYLSDLWGLQRAMLLAGPLPLVLGGTICLLGRSYPARDLIGGNRGHAGG